MKNSSSGIIATIIVVCIVVVALAVAYGFAAGRVTITDNWSPRNYVAKDGDCFVPPQGDPLYDAHYAQEVNVPNCNAFLTQAEARYTQAQTRKENVETNLQIFGLAVFLLTLVGIIGFFAYVATKR